MKEILPIKIDNGTAVVYMEIESSDETCLVKCHTNLFKERWIELTHNPCVYKPTDYEQKGFNECTKCMKISMQHPVPVSELGVLNGESSQWGFSDGIKRCKWLISHDAEYTPFKIYKKHLGLYKDLQI